jgi:hypothetical protein
MPIRLGVEMASLFVLESARLERVSFRPGDEVSLGLRWLSRRQTDSHYTVFVHLVGPDGQLVAQRDREPYEPTSAWMVNRIVSDEFLVAIPVGASPGTYQLRVGLYLSGVPAQRLEVVDPGLTTVEGDSIYIAEVAVQP